MRVVFLGSPAFAVPSLEEIAAGPFEISAVFTQPDRPAGRGRRISPPPVKVRGLELGLEVRQPDRVRAADIDPFSPEVAVVVAYGQILSRKLISLPKRGVLNVHASLLPRWRGAAPIQRALIAGDREQGVSIMQVVPELDAGPVLCRAAVPVGLRETTEVLHERLALLGASLLIETLGRLDCVENAEGEIQDESRVTYANKLSKKEAPIDWSRPAEEIDRRVRGLRPWPVAETPWPGIRGGPVRIWHALLLEEEPERPATPGEVLGPADSAEGAGVRVRTGRGDLLLLEVQTPGGKRMPANAFLQGRSLPPRTRLGAAR